LPGKAAAAAAVFLRAHLRLQAGGALDAVRRVGLRRAARAGRARADSKHAEAEQCQEDEQQRHSEILRSVEHSPEEQQRSRLVERLVQIAALRALNAGRAAVVAGA